MIGIPGGPGTPLTPLGKAQATSVAARLTTLSPVPSEIVAVPTIQTIETAQIVGARLSLPTVVPNELRSINLGVLSGISIEAARTSYPRSSESMDDWRNGVSEIADLRIQGMEDPFAFYGRGASYLLKAMDLANSATMVIVCTTSIMILLHNIHDRRSPVAGGGYRTRSYENGQLVDLIFSDEDRAWLLQEMKRHEIE
ncbi:histidine phosphatase family protein [Bradyrhizobium sp. 141]|nr:histidine phosphatase family protein [Bradyrhizobium sp. 141]